VTSNTEPIRVLCIDDHNLVLEGLTLIINRHSDMKVVASGTNGRQAIALFRQHRPDVTLMDLRLPLMGGIEAIKRIRAEAADACIIVLTTYQGDEDIYQALQAGAATYLLKDTLSDQLIQVIRDAYHRRIRTDQVISKRLAERAARPALTEREVEVVKLLAQGLRNKEIASMLGISEETVQSHVKNIFSKLDVTDRTAAVNVAFRRGIVHLDD
jgi:DNA-binding NarL/FixJ family response regulator